MSSVSVAIASVDPTWAWQDCCRITSQSLKWPSGQFTNGRQTRVWSIRPENIEWEIWRQIQEGPVVLHSGHGPSTSASWRRWVQGDICCAGSQGPYYTSLVQTCRDHLSRVEFIVLFQYLCSFFLPPQIYLRRLPCVHWTLNPSKTSDKVEWRLPQEQYHACNRFRSQKVNPDSIIQCHSQRGHPIHSSESKSWLHN